MPTYTTRLNLPKPTGSESVNRANYNTLIDAIDAAAAKKDDLDTHVADDTAHGATSAATASKIVMRDANKRFKAGAPSSDDDVAIKKTVDDAVTTITTALDLKADSSTLASHEADDVAHITDTERTTWNAKQSADAALAKFKSGSSTYTDNDTSQTFTDDFCTAASLVTISITSGTLPQGVWTVNSAAGSFTITSTVAESADITFDYFISKVV